ncbi:hypothetical protein Scep_025809 [Stephania cephalantha]|uniref:Uncharacterized protein n=1 Tax=Stephania cephalantha TaxID=152367 RepID=A0AAP0ELG2_9MAGN
MLGNQAEERSRFCDSHGGCALGDPHGRAEESIDKMYEKRKNAAQKSEDFEPVHESDRGVSLCRLKKSLQARHGRLVSRQWDESKVTMKGRLGPWNDDCFVDLESGRGEGHFSVGFWKRMVGIGYGGLPQSFQHNALNLEIMLPHSKGILYEVPMRPGRVQRLAGSMTRAEGLAIGENSNGWRFLHCR